MNRRVATMLLVLIATMFACNVQRGAWRYSGSDNIVAVVPTERNIVATTAPSPIATMCIVVIVGDVNVREHADYNSAVVGWLIRGDSVCAERVGDWYSLRDGGYIIAACVDDEKNCK